MRARFFHSHQSSPAALPAAFVGEGALTERWYGTYLKSTTPAARLIEAPAERVRVVTGVGGAGMTLSFGIAEDVLAELGLVESAAQPA